jgi:hypothetical protein
MKPPPFAVMVSDAEPDVEADVGVEAEVEVEVERERLGDCPRYRLGTTYPRSLRGRLGGALLSSSETGMEPASVFPLDTPSLCSEGGGDGSGAGIGCERTLAFSHA